MPMKKPRINRLLDLEPFAFPDHPGVAFAPTRCAQGKVTPLPPPRGPGGGARGRDDISPN